MKLKKKALSLALAGALTLTAAGGLLVGCGNDSDAFELQIFVGGYGTAPWEYVIDLYQQDHPDVEMNVHMSATVNDNMAQRWRNGDPPDFVFIDGVGTDRTGWLENHLLYDLSDWLETAKVNGSDKLIKDVVGEQYFGEYTYDDGTTIKSSMPLIFGSNAIWYDQAWMTENDLSVPTNFTELMQFASDAKSKGTSAMCYTGVYPSYLYEGLIRPAIAAYDDDEFAETFFTASDPDIYVDARVQDVMQRFIDFVNADGMMNGTVSLNHTLSQFRWLHGDAALIANGLWMRNEINNDITNGADGSQTGDTTLFDNMEMRFSTSPLIKADQKQTLVVSTVDCAVSANGGHTEEALDFATYLYREDVAKQFALAAQAPSVVPITFEDGEVDDSFAAIQTMFNDSSISHYYFSATMDMGSVGTLFCNILNEIVDAHQNNGTISTALQYCQRLQAEAQKNQ